jgi:recombination protein RecT
MKSRCLNSKDKRFKDYGGRGIAICERWRNSYDNFLADMGRRPSSQHSLDRYPNNDGDYEPTNCRWATRSDQQQNKRIGILMNTNTSGVPGVSYYSQTNPKKGCAMNQQVATTPQGPKAVIDQFRRDLDKMGPQFAHALPAHIPVERFMRVVMTAIQNQPKLLACSRQSIFNACMKCAADGLLPDSREAAIVPFGDNEDGQKKSDQATYMPMIAGIRKKARNSGEIADLWVREVREGDVFDYQEGDEPHIFHKPSLVGGTERKITHVYSICKFKDGTLSREVMTIQQVEEIRQKFSRAKKGGPWHDRVTYGEMAKKTVVRRHAKQLPSSTDLDDILRRDDELYDMKGAAERGEAMQRRQPKSAMAALEKWADARGEGEGDPSPPQGAYDLGDPQPGDDTVIDRNRHEGAIAAPAGEESQAAPEPTMGDLIGKAQKKPPKDPETFKLLMRQIIAAAVAHGGSEQGDALTAWWTGSNARAMRNAARITGEDLAEITAQVTEAYGQMGEATQ